MKITISIFDLSLGSVGTVIGYNRVYGGYIGKLISRGLLPNTSFVVLDFTAAQSGVKIMLEDRILTLSKPEANALWIETTTEDT